MTTALATIHDVTPDRLDRILRIVRAMDRASLPPAMLLVVPHAGWTTGSLAELRALVEHGHELAGHGWTHAAPPAVEAFHRLHALVISRDQAEHLGRPRKAVLDRIRRSYAWFDSVGLPEPDLYVPPAWALGRLRSEDLRALPFRWFEVLSGIIDSERPGAPLHALPLCGYEGDTPGREVGLVTWNALNRLIARRTGRPVRIAIHPDDLTLRLGHRLGALFDSALEWMRMGDWLRARPAEATRPQSGSGPSASKTRPVIVPSTHRT